MIMAKRNEARFDEIEKKVEQLDEELLQLKIKNSDDRMTLIYEHTLSIIDKQYAVLTIYKAAELGFDAISLQPLTIHKYSLAHALYDVGEYELPWFWSVIEVAKQIENIDDFRIGGLGFYPRPINAAHNRHDDFCENDCNPQFWEAVRDYGKNRDKSVFEKLDCECKDEWLRICDQEDENLHDRIRRKMSKLNLDEYKKKFQNNKEIFPNKISIDGETFFNN